MYKRATIKWRFAGKQIVALDGIVAGIVFSIFSRLGYYAAFFNNAFGRLNREYGGDIDSLKPS